LLLNFPIELVKLLPGEIVWRLLHRAGLVCAALLIPVSVASLPAKQAAADVKAAVGASQHVLAELVGVAGHLLEGLVVVLLPAVEVDALPPLATVAVLGAVVHVTGLGADAPGDLPPVVVSEALAITAVSALLDPELPTVGLLLAEPQGVAAVLVGVGVAHVLETGVTVSLLFRDLVTVTVTDTHGVQGGVSHGHQGRGGGGPGPGILSLEEAEAEPEDHEAAVNSPHHEAGHWVAGRV